MSKTKNTTTAPAWDIEQTIISSVWENTRQSRDGDKTYKFLNGQLDARILSQKVKNFYAKLGCLHFDSLGKPYLKINIKEVMKPKPNGNKFYIEIDTYVKEA